MSGDEAIWRGTASRAGLSEDESELVAELCAAEPEVEAELDFLVGHLSANLGAPFLRRFAGYLRAGQAGAGALMSALHETLGISPVSEGPAARGDGR